MITRSPDAHFIIRLLNVFIALASLRVARTTYPDTDTNFISPGGKSLAGLALTYLRLRTLVHNTASPADPLALMVQLPVYWKKGCGLTLPALPRSYQQG